MMEKKKWGLVVGTLAIIVLATAYLIYIITLGGTSGCKAEITASLSDSVEIEEGAWKIAVHDIDITCDAKYDDVVHFSVMLRKDNITEIPIADLQDGLVAHQNDISIFFDDNNKRGRLDSGDEFYLVGLESESTYVFYLIFELSADIVDTTPIHT
jgi:hypothetical protein